MTTAIIIGLTLCAVFLLGHGIASCMRRAEEYRQEQAYSDGWKSWGDVTDLRRPA